MTALAFVTGLLFGICIMILILVCKLSAGVPIHVNVQNKEAPEETSTNTLTGIQESLDKANKDITDRNQNLDNVLQAINEIMNGGTDNEQ